VKNGFLQVKSNKKRFIIDTGNAYFYTRKKIFPHLFQISKYIGNKISKIKVTQRKQGLITQENLEKYLTIAKP
jgi:hypothetical protein